jgi:hypothetical protein
MEFNSGLQKYRFFAPAGKAILCLHQIDEAPAMSAFWNNLHRLAQGQLFNGGYLHGDNGATPARSSQPTASPPKIRPDERDRTLPHAQIAACR